MSSHRVATRLGAIALSAVLLGGCSDSGGGPLHRPDVSADRIVGPAISSLLPVAVPGRSGEVFVLDHLAPAIGSRADLPAQIRQEIPSQATDGSTAELPQSVRDAIVAGLPGREVRFVPLGPTPLAPSDPKCGLAGDASLLSFAMLPGQAVHGDVYLVAVETWDLCNAWSWAAARMVWQPGGLVGGDWVVGQVIGGAVFD